MKSDSPIHRVKLPDTRPSMTGRKVLRSPNGTYDIYVTVSFYENDQPGEIFIKVGKMGSMVSGWADIAAQLASKMLQTGIPADQVFQSFRHSSFEPRGTDGAGDRVFSSIADAVAVTVMEILSDRGSQPHLNNELREVECFSKIPMSS